MIDIENAVFDTVATAFDAAYPNGSRYSEDNSAPARFPCLTLVEMDNYTYERSLDASLMEHDKLRWRARKSWIWLIRPCRT